MTAASQKVREELILDAAAAGELPLTQVDYYIRQHHPSASIAEVQSKTLGTIRSLADEGLIKLGAMSGEGGRWQAWDGPLNSSLQLISDMYLAHYEDRPAWVFSAWIKLTEAGEQAAKTLEAGTSST